MTNNPTILILDDDECVTRALKRRLEFEGFTVHVAHSTGEAALLVQSVHFAVVDVELCAGQDSHAFVREHFTENNYVRLTNSSLGDIPDDCRGAGAFDKLKINNNDDFIQVISSGCALRIDRLDRDQRPDINP